MHLLKVLRKVPMAPDFLYHIQELVVKKYFKTIGLTARADLKFITYHTSCQARGYVKELGYAQESLDLQFELAKLIHGD